MAKSPNGKKFQWHKSPNGKKFWEQKVRTVKVPRANNPILHYELMLVCSSIDYLRHKNWSIFKCSNKVYVLISSIQVFRLSTTKGIVKDFLKSQAVFYVCFRIEWCHGVSYPQYFFDKTAKKKIPRFYGIYEI